MQSTLQQVLDHQGIKLAGTTEQSLAAATDAIKAENGEARAGDAGRRQRRRGRRRAASLSMAALSASLRWTRRTHSCRAAEQRHWLRHGAEHADRRAVARRLRLGQLRRRRWRLRLRLRPGAVGGLADRAQSPTLGASVAIGAARHGAFDALGRLDEQRLRDVGGGVGGGIGGGGGGGGGCPAASDGCGSSPTTPLPTPTTSRRPSEQRKKPSFGSKPSFLGITSSPSLSSFSNGRRGAPDVEGLLRL